MSNRILNTLLIFAAVFLFAALGFTLYTISLLVPLGFAWPLVMEMAHFLTLAYAIYYIFSGCNKQNGAKFFRLFMILNAATMLFEIAFVEETPFGRLFSAIIFACLCLLAFAKDLGQKKSFTLACGTVLFSIAGLVYTLAVFLDTPSALITVYATQVVLGMTALLMVAAKYDDKKQRGTT